MNDLPLPPAESSRTVAVRRYRLGHVTDAHDGVAEEVPVALEYNGISHAVMLATPADLEDFAHGFSMTEGLVDDGSQIRDVEVSRGPQGITLHISIAASCFARLKDRRRSLTGRTGCGLCGTDSLAQAVRPPAHVASPDPLQFEASAVSRALSALRDQQPLLGVTGATHAAAWCNAAGDIMLLREDVGRHNALDKLVGALTRGKLPVAEGFVVVTSRASYEMVHKTAAAGASLLAAVSGVTGLAIDMAEAAGVALLGFARGDDLSVYCHGERVHLPETP